MPLTGQFTSLPPDVVDAQWNGNMLEGRFVLEADFANDDGTCANGEYRQYIRGSYLVNGARHDHVLCGDIIISQDEFQQDGCPPPVCTAYGYRVCADNPKNRYTPDRPTGCHYHMEDEPALQGFPGETLELDLEFRGVLINTESAEVLAEHTWRVRGQYTVPNALESERTIKTSRGEGIRARLALDVEGGWSGSLTFARRVGDLPDGTPDVNIIAYDASGNKLGFDSGAGGQVRELGDSLKRTTHLSFRIAPGQPDPHRLSVGYLGDTIDIPLVAH